MYRVTGSTNYECYCGEDEIYAEHISLYMQFYKAYR